MSKQKTTKENAWKARKENQQPHGKVKSFDELGSDIKGRNNDNR